jgi:hypothetical protein
MYCRCSFKAFGVILLHFNVVKTNWGSFSLKKNIFYLKKIWMGNTHTGKPGKTPENSHPWELTTKCLISVNRYHQVFTFFLAFNDNIKFLYLWMRQTIKSTSVSMGVQILWWWRCPPFWSNHLIYDINHFTVKSFFSKWPPGVFFPQKNSLWATGSFNLTRGPRAWRSADSRADRGRNRILKSVYLYL